MLKKHIDTQHPGYDKEENLNTNTLDNKTLSSEGENVLKSTSTGFNTNCEGTYQ